MRRRATAESCWTWLWGCGATEPAHAAWASPAAADDAAAARAGDGDAAPRGVPGEAGAPRADPDEDHDEAALTEWLGLCDW